MKYLEVALTIQAPASGMQDARDILAALTAEAGFEALEETEDGLTGYVQQSLFDEEALRGIVATFPLEGVTILYNVREAESRDWNEAWEQQGFEPIRIGDQMVIHDGRHLPQAPYPASIEIDARLAFGTGSHETTRMICAELLGMELGGKRVLDCGCGTGILGIAALKLGAERVTAYDIDEWSVDNTRHNAVINHVDERLASLLGDASLLEELGDYDVVLANINRNILLADLPRFVKIMASGASLVLSGFYTDDYRLLKEKATACGLRFVRSREDGQWGCLVFSKE